MLGDGALTNHDGHGAILGGTCCELELSNENNAMPYGVRSGSLFDSSVAESPPRMV